MEMDSMKRTLFALTLFTAVAAAPLSAQAGGRITVEPFVGYGFFGGLPGGGELDAALTYGARGGFQLAPQWAAFGTFQRSNPEAAGVLGIGSREVTVDHWSTGIEFSYVPRGGAEGMLPILMEAGIGQARYDTGTADLAVNIGIASALQLTPNLAIRYGANDYISNYRGGDGIVNQIFVRVGAELRF
jgi:hypothetical protein